MAYLLKVGGQQVGTEVVYVLPSGERLGRPVEDNPVGFGSAVVTEVAAGVIWRPSFEVWHEESDMFVFCAWLHAMVRRMRNGRQDVTVWDDTTLKLTYPQCAFASFSRPKPQSPAEAFFCADVTFEFVTDQDPY